MRVLSSDEPRAVEEVAIAPAGDLLAAVVRDWGVCVWHLAADGPPEVLDPVGMTGSWSLQFDPAGRLFWAADGRLYRRPPLPEREPIPVGAAGEYVLALARCGDRYVAATIDRERPGASAPQHYRLQCWAGEPAGDGAEAWCVGPTPDWIEVAVGGAAADRVYTVECRAGVHDYQLVCRSAADGTVVSRTRYPKTYLPPRSAVKAAAPDGSAVALVSHSAVIVWHPGEPLRRVRAANRQHFTGAAYHPSGAYLAAANTDGTVRLFDTDSWQVTRQYDWGVGRLECVAFSPDGALGAAGTADGRVVLWDVD